MSHRSREAVCRALGPEERPMALGLVRGNVLLDRRAVRRLQVRRPWPELVALALLLFDEGFVRLRGLGPRDAFDAGAPLPRKPDAAEVETHAPSLAVLSSRLTA